MPERVAVTARDLAARIRHRRARIVLIDGPSGAGKSTLATALAGELGAEADLVRMDELYPGWGGLAAGSAFTERFLVGPLRRGLPGRYRRWNWAADSSARWREVDPDRILILEGCGAATTTNRRAASFTVWVQAEDVLRRERALARDGAVFAAHWDEWDAQFRRHVVCNDPRSAADVVIET